MTHPTVFFATFLLALLCVGANAYALTCDICDEAVEGKYRLYQSDRTQLTVCLKCDSSVDHCELCKIPLRPRDARSLGNHTLCRRCASNAKVCSQCQTFIKSRYFEIPDTGEVLCESCDARLPHCARCKRALSGTEAGQNNIDNKQRFCSKCWNETPRCAGCGKILTDAVYSYRGTDLVFCPSCESKSGRCYSCGLPLGEDGIEMADGRQICIRCQDQAVLRQEDIDRMWVEVQTYLRKQGFKVKHSLPLHVVDRKKLKEIILTPAGSHEMGAFRLQGDDFSIYVLSAMPAPFLYETLAHEYGHAWQAEHCPQNQEKSLCEGFAEWVATQILIAKRYQLQLMKIEDRTDEYGEGCRKLKRMERSLGRKRMLDFVCKSQRFPPNS